MRLSMPKQTAGSIRARRQEATRAPGTLFIAVTVFNISTIKIATNIFTNVRRLHHKTEHDMISRDRRDVSLRRSPPCPNGGGLYRSRSF